MKYLTLTLTLTLSSILSQCSFFTPRIGMSDKSVKGQVIHVNSGQCMTGTAWNKHISLKDCLPATAKDTEPYSWQDIKIFGVPESGKSRQMTLRSDVNIAKYNDYLALVSGEQKYFGTPPDPWITDNKFEITWTDGSGTVFANKSLNPESDGFHSLQWTKTGGTDDNYFILESLKSECDALNIPLRECKRTEIAGRKATPSSTTNAPSATSATTNAPSATRATTTTPAPTPPATKSNSGSAFWVYVCVIFAVFAFSAIGIVAFIRHKKG